MATDVPRQFLNLRGEIRRVPQACVKGAKAKVRAPDHICWVVT